MRRARLRPVVHRHQILSPALSLAREVLLLTASVLRALVAATAAAARTLDDARCGETGPPFLSHWRLASWLTRSSGWSGFSARAALSLSGFAMIVLCIPWSTMADDAPIPTLSLWESNMVLYGRRHCERLATPGPTLDDQLAVTYYDAIRVMYQIADYTADASWGECARLARSVYRDEYVFPYNGEVAGYRNFTTGLLMDSTNTADPLSKQAVILLAQNALYATDWTPIESTVSARLGREVAYAIMSYIDAEKLGEPRRARRQILVDQAYGHLAQGFVQFTWQGTTDQVSPFGVAITAQALIRDWEQTADPRLVPILETVCDYLWANAWVGAAQAMKYNINPGSSDPQDPAPDLNLVIAPMYAWLYAQTQDVKYRERADALFEGGVRYAWLDGAKQFNQNYWWSFDYVRWRRASSAPTVLTGTIMSPTSLQADVTAPSNLSVTQIAAPTTLPGSTSHSLSLNGTEAYVSVPNSASLDITGAITLEAWIKTNSATAQQGIIERYRTLGFGTSDGGYGLRLADGKLMFFTAKNGYEFDAVFGTSGLTTGVWHHVAGVFDGVQLRVYLDGVLDGAKASTFPPGTGTNTLKLGARGDDATYTFNGLIDQPRVTAAAVYTTNFVPSALTALPGTRGLWTFDDQSAVDSSGNGNDGTLSEGASFLTDVPAETMLLP